MNYTDASLSEIDSAIAAAKAAFPIYRRISDSDRATFLQAISREILALGDELIQTACSESHLPEARITGERGRTTGQIQAFADFISNPAWKKEIHDPAMPDRAPFAKPGLFLTPIPINSVPNFFSYNFKLIN